MTLNPTGYKAEFLVSAKDLPLPTVDLIDNKHMLLLLTVHEVFLESGFVPVDSVSRKQIGFQIPEDWPFKAFAVHYIPTKLLDNAADDDYVSLKFQTCGHLVSVYGRLIPDQVYQLCLNNHVPYHEELWKTVKGRIAYPLLIDIFYMICLNPTGDRTEFLGSAKYLPLPTMYLNDNKHMLLLLTVHELFLESGFVAVDSVSGKQIVFQIPEDWPFKAFTVHYIPTKLLDNVADDHYVSLKFQACGHLVSVYGRLIPDQVYQLCLNNHISCHEEFWKTVKDRIVYPLLIDTFYMICLNPTDYKVEFLASAKDLPLRTMHLNDNKHMLLLLTVHEVFLESGFVAVDSVFRKQILFQIPEDWPFKALTLHYIPTKLLAEDNVAPPDDYVSVKFETCGRLVNVYARLNSIPDQVYQLCLNNHAPDDREEFWKTVKDKLVYPLLIDICYKTGLALPPCFMSLPADLKLIILESLPGFDVARMECVCRELRTLSSENEKQKWKQKYEKECAAGSCQYPVVFGSRKNRFLDDKKEFLRK